MTRTTSAQKQLLETNMDKLHLMANALIKYETIDSGQIDSDYGRQRTRAAGRLARG